MRSVMKDGSRCKIGVARGYVVSFQARVIDGVYSGVRWKAEPQRVIVPYAKYSPIIMVTFLKYHETREILWEATATMW